MKHSKYRGDNWDTFFSQLPSALVKHLNGNAIYNLTSPFFGMLVDQLESEAVSVENSVAFDYRISQILEEAKFGTRPSFSPYLRATYPSTNLSEAIKKNANQIKAAVRETPVIGNYASTNIVSAYLDSREAIIHGAKLRTAWNKETLGVSRCFSQRCCCCLQYFLTESIPLLSIGYYTRCFRLARREFALSSLRTGRIRSSIRPSDRNDTGWNSTSRPQELDHAASSIHRNAKSFQPGSLFGSRHDKVVHDDQLFSPNQEELAVDDTV
jgi:hypothetical protein